MTDKTACVPEEDFTQRDSIHLTDLGTEGLPYAIKVASIAQVAMKG